MVAAWFRTRTKQLNDSVSTFISLESVTIMESSAVMVIGVPNETV